MPAAAPHLRSLLIGLLSIYLFIYPFAILLIALDSVPVWGRWMGGALLILQGTLMGLWLRLNYWRRGVLVAALILLLAWAVEHIGVITGFPFGTYSYTDVLAPKIAGVVPLAIPFAWLLVVPAAVGITEHLLFKPHTSTLTRVLMAALFALLLDITIEPVAVHINGYWVWDHDSVGGYYGVPPSNFVAWWGTSVVLVWLMLRFRHPPRQRGLPPPPTIMLILPWMPPLLYVLNLVMFVLVNLAHGKTMAAVIGGLILIYLALVWYAQDVRRRGSKAVRRLVRLR
jgi:putative membrane protein